MKFIQTCSQNLEKEHKKNQGVLAIQGDANNLSQILERLDIQSPVILSLQNSLGTWEGNAIKAIRQMRKAAEREKGEVIISLLRQEALIKWGIDFYKSLEPLAGGVDLEKCDFENGIFRSKTGYLSRWRAQQKRKEIKTRLAGQKVAEILTSAFWILHVSYQ